MASPQSYRNPLPTVDIIIEIGSGIILIERKNPPAGWALPGGFVDYGESLEAAAVREAEEETALKVELIELTVTDAERWWTSVDWESLWSRRIKLRG